MTIRLRVNPIQCVAHGLVTSSIAVIAGAGRALTYDWVGSLVGLARHLAATVKKSWLRGWM